MENKIEVNLRGLRLLNNMTQDELASKIDKSSYTIRNWEIGNSSPKIQDYFKLKKILDPEDKFFLQF
ncbi:helix-turn-helix transcriptional regulator [Helcococcus kunzii]|uniref:helix-turn-helix transcriptional regulator n=1 Tax=Helcococcus kunzii TaxID=40091 RepID=UPI001BAE87F7|nr:helix-turn-helix transcriptional regulator [Helcococcus kunzii]QUY64263.1 helix-turn-helix transcriptional regulator [Helcococcus kunzii]